MIPVDPDNLAPLSFGDGPELLFLVRRCLPVGAHAQIQRYAMRRLDHGFSVAGWVGRGLACGFQMGMAFRKTSIYGTDKHVSRRPIISVVRIAEIWPGFLNPFSRGLTCANAQLSVISYWTCAT